MPEEEEKEHINKCIEIQTKVCGQRPLGLYQGKVSENTKRLAIEEGGFMYLNDW